MKQISEIIYSYSRINEQFPDLYAAYIPEIIKRSKELKPMEVVNIYWGFATAKLFNRELFEFLEKEMIFPKF